MNLIPSKICFIIITTLVFVACSNAFASTSKIYLLGENHHDPLAINIKPKLMDKCMKNEIFYVLEGIMREPMDEYSYFGKKHVYSPCIINDYCFGIEEPISYYLTVASLAYCYTLTEEPSVYDFWSAIIVSRKRNPAINSIFKYLRKNGNDETKTLLGNINDELLNLEFHHRTEIGYKKIHEKLDNNIIKSLGTKEQWLSFLKQFLEILWTHGEALDGFESTINQGFLEKLFTFETAADIHAFLKGSWNNIALDLRDIFMAENILTLYREAKTDGKHLVTSVGANHLIGIKKLLMPEVSEEDIVIIDTNDKNRLADIVIELIEITTNATHITNKTIANSEIKDENAIEEHSISN